MPGEVLDPELYPLDSLLELPSPSLVVFERHVEHNIARMREILEAIAPGSGFAHLRPHAKTHKSSWAARKLLAAGVRSFKSTPHELACLLESGARDVFVAYPLLASAATEVLDLAARYPEARIACQVSKRAHAEILEDAARKRRLSVEVFLDLDVGDHRTGLAPQELREVARAVASFPSLELVGLHAYDGHNHDPDPAARRRCAEGYTEEIVASLEALSDEGHRVRELVVSGSPGFEPCLETILARRERTEALASLRIEASPGTWIYWDSKYDALLPDRFRYAALLLARVLDTTRDGRLTLDLGHKRWGIDQGPIEVFSRRGLRVAKTSEEHTVLVDDEARAGRRPPLEVGDPVLFAPRHVCPTVNLWETFWLIRSEGSRERLPVDGRNR